MTKLDMRNLSQSRRRLTYLQKNYLEDTVLKASPVM